MADNEMTALSERAMLASVNISQWAGRQLDRTITEQVNKQHAASAAAGRYNKCLIDPQRLKPIQQAANAARAYLMERTLPWAQDGARILPAALYVDFERAMAGLKADFDREVRAFVAEYPAAIDQAEIDLNGMFRRSDYPDAADIGRRFSMRTSVLPVPSAADFRVDIGEAQAAAVRADIEKTVTAAQADAMADLWQRVAGVVGHMAEKLASYQPGNNSGEKARGIFRDSLVDNVRDLARILPALNIASDPRLAAIAARISDKLTQTDAAELRENAAARDSVAADAAGILADMADYI